MVPSFSMDSVSGLVLILKQKPASLQRTLFYKAQNINRNKLFCKILLHNLLGTIGTKVIKAYKLAISGINNAPRTVFLVIISTNAKFFFSETKLEKEAILFFC